MQTDGNGNPVYRKIITLQGQQNWESFCNAVVAVAVRDYGKLFGDDDLLPPKREGHTSYDEADQPEYELVLPSRYRAAAPW
jgi:hypothetical protein